MSKKKRKTIEELLQKALVPVEDQLYEVSENWVWTRLEYIAEWGSGGTPKSTVKEYYNGDIPWLVIGDLNDSFIKTSQRSITELGLKNSSAKLVPKGSILVAMYGSIGKLGVADIPCATNQAIAYANVNHSTLNMYLFYYLMCNKGRLIALGKGGTQQNISQTVLKSLSFPLPPIEEQKRIVDKVERLLDKINQVKQLIEEAKETFELRRATILDKAFRGELTAKWREENKNKTISGMELFDAIKSERLKNVDSNRELNDISQMFNDFVLEESIDDNGWLRLKANMFCININCGGTPSEFLSETGEVPFLKVYNIVNNKVDFEYKPQFIPKGISDSRLMKSLLYPNDVIMNIVGPPLKKIAIIPDDYPEWNMNQAIVRFRPIKYVLPKFVYYCLQYDETLIDVVNATRGVVGQSNISVNQSRNLIMPIPSIQEQHEIIKILDWFFEKEEAALEILEFNETYLDKMAQSILLKAFQGKLGTNNPDETSSLELISEALLK